MEMTSTRRVSVVPLLLSSPVTSKLPSRYLRSPPPPRFGPLRIVGRRRRGVMLPVRSGIDDPSSLSEKQQQADLSVLRFTLGIPGLDESYLPRYLGVGFGSLVILNHFVSAAPPTPAQIITEALGIFLSAFSATLPYIGRFLKGASLTDRSPLKEGNSQIFVMSENLIDNIKEDLAWESFVLLRNTNTMSVLILLEGALCIRGYWNPPEATSKADILDWFSKQIRQNGLTELNDALYFPENRGQIWGILPKGAASLLLQPVLGTCSQRLYKNKNVNGFILLVSSSSYAYRDRDRAWIRAIGKKIGGSAFNVN